MEKTDSCDVELRHTTKHSSGAIRGYWCNTCAVWHHEFSVKTVHYFADGTTYEEVE
jgi:hypothetical protein